MPVYEFRCPTCGAVFEERRPMSRSGEPAVCPEGHAGAVRLLSVFAATGGSGEAPQPPGPCGGACACYPD